MENWRRVWRDGFAKVISTAGLTALRDAIKQKDSRLGRGFTALPTFVKPEDKTLMLDCSFTRNPNAPVEYACAIGICGWLGEGKNTIKEVCSYFYSICRQVEEKLHTPNADSFFITWFDYTPAEISNRELLYEIELELGDRAARETAPVPAVPAESAA